MHLAIGQSVDTSVSLPLTSRGHSTVRHKTVMEKVAEVHMPDQVYSWIVDFLCDH